MKKYQRAEDFSPKEQNLYENMNRQAEAIMRQICGKEHSKGSDYRYVSAMKNFNKFLAVAYSKENLNRIENRHLEAYVEQMQEAGFSRSTITNALSAIRYFVDKLHYDGYAKKFLASNRELGVEPRNKEDRLGKERAWTQREKDVMFARALEQGKMREHDLMRMADQFGVRIHEAIKTEKEQLDKALRSGQLHVIGKGGLERNIPVRTEAQREFLRYLSINSPKHAKTFVCEGEKAHEVKSKMQNWIIREREQLQDKDRSKDREADRYELTFHGLRHGYCQSRYEEIRQSGKDERQAKLEVSREMGHFRPEITDIYLAK